jgi:hypothetical protein
MPPSPGPVARAHSTRVPLPSASRLPSGFVSILPSSPPIPWPTELS